jgi:hypothetical protein
MIIKGKIEEYHVDWEGLGWSYAQPVVRVKRRILGLPITRWKRVWDGEHKRRTVAQQMLPIPMEQWYKGAVDAYEVYVKKWKEHKDAWEICNGNSNQDSKDTKR